MNSREALRSWSRLGEVKGREEKVSKGDGKKEKKKELIEGRKRKGKGRRRKEMEVQYKSREGKRKSKYINIMINYEPYNTFSPVLIPIMTTKETTQSE